MISSGIFRLEPLRLPKGIFDPSMLQCHRGILTAPIVRPASMGRGSSPPPGLERIVDLPPEESTVTFTMVSFTMVRGETERIAGSGRGPGVGESTLPNGNGAALPNGNGAGP